MIRIYSKEACKYCAMAKELAASAEIEYEEMTVGPTANHDIDRIDFMNQFQTVRSLPLILKVNAEGEITETIGGYTEFKEKVDSDAL